MLRWLSFVPLLLAPAALAQDLSPQQAELKSTVQFLASDALRGREAGTHDFDVAAEYMAAQMLAVGLRPGGEKGSWFQSVQLVTYRPAERGTMTLTVGKADVPMLFGRDFVNLPVPSSPDFKAEGPVVFAGYGVIDPQSKRDDYRGLDVAGKIVAVLSGVPKGITGDVAALLDDDDQKAAIAQAHGAKAVVVLESAESRHRYSFAAVAAYYDYQRNGWAGADGTAYSIAPRAPVVDYLSQAGAEKLFTGARIKWQAVAAAEASGGRMPTGPLAVTLAAASKTRVRTSPSRNVIGLLEGSDPALKGQYVLVSAHLDHVGVGEPVNGDRIYNGAMDNAVGNAMILEIARGFQASGKRPRRSILFLSLTGEEKGLLGSEYFAVNPVVPKERIVGDINIDMPILTYPLVDLVVDGGERMSLGETIAEAAAGEGMKIVADPTPEENFFIRSDHYSFVKAGIPAVSIDTGPGGEGAAASKHFLDTNYHQPSDQIDLPFNWDSAIRYLHVAEAAVHSVANADERPRFVKGDFFGVQFGGYGAQ